jgi:predicted dehydrogenase
VKPLRAAIVGYGLAGSVFHGPLIAGTRGLEVATVVTSDRERRERAAADHPSARIVAHAEELWSRAGDHDLAVIATTNETHAPLTRAALEAGLPVVVDKPLATTAADARTLVAQSASAGLLLTTFHNRRWDSDHLTLERLMAEGRLAEVRRYESRFERWRPRRSAGAWRESTAPERGGGVLVDLGTHLVDQALRLFGPAEVAHAEDEHRRGDAGDDDAFVVLRHARGTVSHLWASAVAPAPGPRLRVAGSEAGFVVEGVDSQEDALRRGGRPSAGEPWGAEPQERWGRLVRGELTEPVPSEPGAWPEFYAALASALASGGPPPVDPADAIAVLEVLETARGIAATDR